MDRTLVAYTNMEHPQWKTTRNVVDQLLTQYAAICTFSDMCVAITSDLDSLDELHLARCLHGLDVPDSRLKFLVMRWCTERIHALRKTSDRFEEGEMLSIEKAHQVWENEIRELTRRTCQSHDQDDTATREEKAALIGCLIVGYKQRFRIDYLQSVTHV